MIEKEKKHETWSNRRERWIINFSIYVAKLNLNFALKAEYIILSDTAPTLYIVDDFAGTFPARFSSKALLFIFYDATFCCTILCAIMLRGRNIFRPTRNSQCATDFYSCLNNFMESSWTFRNCATLHCRGDVRWEIVQRFNIALQAIKI